MTAIDRLLIKAAPQIARPRTRRAPRNRGKVAKGVVTRTPFWDVDLGSRQAIAGVHLALEDGAALRNFWVMLSDTPFPSVRLTTCLRASDVWRYQYRGAAEGAITVACDAGVRARFIRIQAVSSGSELPIATLDVALPAPSLRLDIEAITDSKAGPRPASAAPAQADSEMTLNLETAAGRSYTIGFDLPPQEAVIQAWWNGTLCTPDGFRAKGAKASQAFECVVTGTGSDDRLTFKAIGASSDVTMPQNVSFRLKRDKTPVPYRRRRARKPVNAPHYGTLSGILRRKPKQKQLLSGVSDTAVRSCLEGFMESEALDEIIFR